MKNDAFAAPGLHKSRNTRFSIPTGIEKLESVDERNSTPPGVASDPQKGSFSILRTGGILGEAQFRALAGIETHICDGGNAVFLTGKAAQNDVRIVNKGPFSQKFPLRGTDSPTK